LLGAVPLGRENVVERLRLLGRRREVQVRIDGPPSRRPEILRQPVAKAVVDMQVQVETFAGNPLQLVGPKVLDVHQPCQRPSAVDAGRLGPHPVVKDEGHTPDVHAQFLPRVMPPARGGDPGSAGNTAR
jgi:hypothetical protein